MRERRQRQLLSGWKLCRSWSYQVVFCKKHHFNLYILPQKQQFIFASVLFWTNSGCTWRDSSRSREQLDEGQRQERARYVGGAERISAWQVLESVRVSTVGEGPEVSDHGGTLRLFVLWKFYRLFFLLNYISIKEHVLPIPSIPQVRHFAKQAVPCLGS